MEIQALRALTVQKARQLACAFHECEHHDNGKKGGSASEEAHLILENYGKQLCMCSKLIKELTPTQAQEAVALVLMGRTLNPDETGEVVPDGTLEQFRQDAQRLPASDYLHRRSAGRFIHLALDYLETHPFSLSQEHSSSMKHFTFDDNLEDLGVY